MNFNRNMCVYVDNGRHIEVGKYPYKRIIVKENKGSNPFASTKKNSKSISKSIKRIRVRMAKNSRKMNRGK